MPLTTPPVALTIAGSDPVGGAGAPADLRTFAALGVHGAAVLTVVTSQNTTQFRAAVPLPPGIVLSQMESVLDDFAVGGTKTGMLFNEAVAMAVATIARSGRLPNLVVDPVLCDRTGRRIIDVAVDRCYLEDLFGSARVVTPNHLEAALLVNRELTDDLDDIAAAAVELLDRGPECVVITGGRRGSHDDAVMVDVVVDRNRTRHLRSPRVDTVNVRGSGDTFSAAVAARLAIGDDIDAAIDAAHALTAAAIVSSARWRLGSGPGPVDQGAWIAGRSSSKLD